MNDLIIIALEYLEPEYRQTELCLNSWDFPIVCAKRDGVGNYSRAFNEAFQKTWNNVKNYKYVWMISNITFEKNVPYGLIDAMNLTGYAAIHPAMKSSDHAHLRPDGSKEIKEAKFIEWTAPIVRTDIFNEEMLDEMLAYYYMDLDWSYRVKQRGFNIGVDHSCTIDHVYLKNKTVNHPISSIRKQLRNYWTPISKNHMKEKYGNGWEELMGWKVNKNAIHADNLDKIKGVSEEIKFWKRFVATDYFKKEWEGNKVCIELEKEQPEVVQLFNYLLSENNDLKVLDCGSGVVSILHGLVPQENLTATDLLADEYAAFYNYENKGITRPLAIAAENLPEEFSEQFDVVHMRNALDHCQNSFKALEKLISCCKPGGYLIVHGFENEAIQEGWKGMHQWNIAVENERLKIQNSKEAVFFEGAEMAIAKRLPSGKNWFIWVIKKIIA